MGQTLIYKISTIDKLKKIAACFRQFTQKISKFEEILRSLSKSIKLSDS